MDQNEDIDINIFWSGGWDSTFRLLQISQIDGARIHPIYIRDTKRAGMLYEISAMEEMLPEIRRLARGWIEDVEFYERGAIYRDFPNWKITQAYKRLADEFYLGYQYELFALLAEGLDIRIECGLEYSDRSKAKRVLDETCELEKCSDESGRYERLRVAESGGCSDGAVVFKRIDLGMLDISKVEAKRIATERGWMDIMNKTWFCHSPVKGRPCGKCNPCVDALNEGMEWRVPESARPKRKKKGK